MQALDLATAAGGLGLYLLSLRVMASAFDRSLGRWLRPRLQSALASPARALGLGVVIGAPSAPAAMALLIAALAADLLALEQAVLVMIGTTVGSVARVWTGALAPVWLGPVLVGAASVGLIIARHPRARHGLQALLGLGLAFTGLELVSAALAPIVTDEMVRAGLAGWAGMALGEQVLDVGLGVLLGVCLPAGGAVIVALDLAARGSLPVPAACALLLGASIATATWPALAALEHGRTARALAAAHVGVRLVGALAALLAFPLLLATASGAAGGLGLRGPVAEIGVAATIFALANAAAWLCFFTFLYEPLRRLLPGTGAAEGPLAAGVRRMLVNAPDRALAEVYKLAGSLQTTAKRQIDRDLGMMAQATPVTPDHKAIEDTRREIGQVREAAYGLLLPLARGTLSPSQAASAQHWLLFISLADKLVQQALDLRDHLEHGLAVDGYVLPPAIARCLPDLRDVSDQLWLAILFPERQATGAAMEFQQAMATEIIQLLDDAYFEYLKTSDYRKTDQNVWILDTIAQLRHLSESLFMLYKAALAGVEVTRVVPGRSAVGPSYGAL